MFQSERATSHSVESSHDWVVFADSFLSRQIRKDCCGCNTTPASQAGDARCPTCHEASSLLESTKWIDMGVSLHAELFIHNPASTFSWMIFVVRSALGLKTVPSISDDYDLYLRHPHNNPAHLKWVNWKSIQARTEIFNNSNR